MRNLQKNLIPKWNSANKVSQLIEELPNEDIIYKVTKYGSKRFPQTKVIKKIKVIKNKFI